MKAEEHLFKYGKWIRGRRPAVNIDLSTFSRDGTASVRRFHASVPGYAPTPLADLRCFARQAGIRAMMVKDESKRFGLNAFKGLGGLYAVFGAVCDRCSVPMEEASYSLLTDPQTREKIKDMIFITTTDGNHGKGVSYAAGLMGCRSFVYMPKGSSEARARAIRDAGGAETIISDLNYDDCVRYTARLAEENGWTLIQDTYVKGSETASERITRAYTTLFWEALDQMKEQGLPLPTHIFLQAGVGSMACAMLCAARSELGDDLTVCLVEPEEVACVYASAAAEDGLCHPAEGSGQTIMAGLNCGEVNPAAWPYLWDLADYYICCPDCVAEDGMRFYAFPQGTDGAVTAGESGAPTGGLVHLLCTDPECADLRRELGLGPQASVLVINTEGDTDPESYRAIVYGK